ncbi:hypothetical protein GCM10009737_31990 [Nocardioides lentus]|uniref:Cytoskeleton protein RodZ-like C-terminal domain-containing protein n=1 Tax=Nocardioides lentus TaxID=338077 RepID=A0ABP5B0B1_9ACTN
MGEAARIHDEQTTTGRGPAMTAVPGGADGDRTPGERPEPRVLEVRRNAALAGVVGVVAAAVAIAYLGRATATGAPLDWALTAVTALIAGTWLWNLVDARTPLLVADVHGVRVRLGRTWEGLPWRGLDRIEHHPRRGLGRDGRLVLVPEATTPLLEGLDRTGRRHAALARRLHGAPFAVPLSLSTRLSGVRPDEVAEVLRALAGDDARVVEPEPAPTSGAPEDAADEGPAAPEDARPRATATTTRPRVDVAEEAGAERLDARDTPDAGDLADPEDEQARRRPGDPRPALATLIGSLAARVGRRDAGTSDDDRDDRDDRDDHVRAEADEPTDHEDHDDHERTEELVGWSPADAAAAAPDPEPVSDTPEPARERRAVSRAEVQRRVERVAPTAEVLPEARELRRPGSVDLVADDEVWGARVRPIARPGDTVDPIVLDDFSTEPATDPVVGPELAAARTRLNLSVDQLAERTRIRPHVIESIEVDDFAPCGGDFYARGHLRTLARVLGVDAGPLLATYDERYADAPIDPRRVFAAELATGAHGSIRGTRGGPSWTMLLAAVMLVVLVWSVARLVMDDPVELQPVPQLNGSSGPADAAPVAPPVPMTVTAVDGGATVTITDAAGEILFSGDLAVGESTQVDASPPVQVESSDGGATAVSIDGDDRGRLGEAGQPASSRFVPN